MQLEIFSVKVYAKCNIWGLKIRQAVLLTGVITSYMNMSHFAFQTVLHRNGSWEVTQWLESSTVKKKKSIKMHHLTLQSKTFQGNLLPDWFGYGGDLSCVFLVWDFVLILNSFRRYWSNLVKHAVPFQDGLVWLWHWFGYYCVNSRFGSPFSSKIVVSEDCVFHR